MKYNNIWGVKIMAVSNKKIIAIMAALLVLFSFFAASFCDLGVPCSLTVKAATNEPAVLLDDYNYFVYDIERGQTLIAGSENTQFMYPELLTTLVGLLSLEKLQSTGKITASKSTLSRDGNLLLEAGKVYTVQSLENACIVGNADNAAELLLEKMGISDIATFLNEFAENNNFSSTYFVSENAFTTASDLAKILKLALENSEFYRLFCSTYVSGPSGEIITNSNEIVFENTEDSLGGNFSSKTASFLKENDDVHLITIVNGVNEKEYLEVEKFAENKAENNFKKLPLVEVGDIVTGVKLGEKSTREVYYVANETVYVYQPTDGSSIISATTFSYEEGFSEEDIKLPIEKGTRTGTVTYTLTDGTIITIPMYAMTDVHFANTLIDNIRSSIIIYRDIYIIVCFLLILLIFIIIYKAWLRHI